jgi:Ca2+-binding RTX toxin-like protein
MRARVARTLLSIALLPLLLFLVPSQAAPAGHRDGELPDSLRMQLLRRAPYRSLEAAVGKGAVAREVARAAAAGSAEGFLILDGGGSLDEALGRAPSGAGRTASILEATRSAYAAQKDRVLARLPGVAVLQDYEQLPLVLVRFADASAVLGASNDPEVAGIGADRRRETNLAQSLPLIGQPTAAGAGHTGAGFSVAVMDTGVDFTDPAFGSCTSPGSPASCRVVVAQDTAPNDGQLDDDGHGTNVSGIVAGVAPGADLLVYDVFDGNGAFDSDIIQAIDAAIANQATFNVVALNMSLGAPEDYNTSECGGGGNPYVAAFSNARAVGIAPVVAAGNDAFALGGFTNGISDPACTPGAVRVGAVYDGNNGGLNWGDCVDATTTADQITCFSQSASILTMLAPGALIVAAGIEQGGTSQASPHVAGAFAVLHDASPGHSIDQITSALADNGPSILDSRNGVTKHRLDLPSAIADLQGEPTPTPTPTPTPGTCTITGTNSSEVLLGTSSDDVICGKGGDDYLVPGGGNDTVIGGGGFDFVSLEDANGPVVIDLGTGTVTGFGTKTLTRIEGAVGSPFADTISGNSSSNDILGFGGDDLLFGRGGFDYLRFDFANGVIADLSQGLSDGEGFDSYTGFEGIVGSPGGDVLAGKRGGNEIFGLQGGDDILGFGGNDDLFGMGGPDDLFGGKGDDDMFGGPGRDDCVQGPGSGVENSC